HQKTFLLPLLRSHWFPVLDRLVYISPAFHPIAFDPDTITCRSYLTWLFAWFAVLWETFSPIPILFQEFFDACWPAFVLRQDVWIFDPAMRNNFLSMEYLLPCQVPGSSRLRYQGNTCRELLRSPFPCIGPNGAPASVQIRHQGGW